MEEIKAALYEMFSAGEIETSDLLITNERHLSCLKTTYQQVENAINDSKTATLDVVASSVRAAWETLGQITGTNAQEDIINRIYSKFCLGK